MSLNNTFFTYIIFSMLENSALQLAKTVVGAATDLRTIWVPISRKAFSFLERMG